MIRKYDGRDLAKVLTYYGLVEDITKTDFNICCPFHNDPGPSFRVTLGNGQYYCFGCGLSGDAYTFVKTAHPQLNELQALIVLEKILNSKEVKRLQFRYKRRKKKNEKLYLDMAHDYYYGLLQNDWYNPRTKEEKEVLNYMKERGFTEYDLTICKSKTNCYNYAYPLIFPIYDNGLFSGWVSRTIRKNVESKRKYLYNEGFKKRYVLCGRYEEGCVPYLCEGYMDYLSIRARGHVRNVVAIMGWHISDEQIKKLKQKNIKKVVCALDNPEIDKSGKKGLELLQKHFDVVFFPYPDGIKDAGEMSKEQLSKAVRIIRNEIKSGSKAQNDFV